MNKIFPIIATLLFTTLSITGCNQTKESGWATGHKFDGLKNPEKSKALLYVMREKHFHREHEWPVVMLNNKPIINLKNAGYSFIQVQPGTYTVTTNDSDWATETTITLKANDTYFLALGVETNITVGHAESMLQFVTLGAPGGAARASRKWSLLDKNDAVFRLQHYRFTPAINDKNQTKSSGES
ncbi:MAG: hypothetical protein COA54_15275 [Thiotrichaceae bacterium]|nr:MAG: hypothetical protein COA54_15275 [Thiotrichaceae bacterium]